ncbi:hypothetical protein SAMN05444267_102166 [Chryseobacterium polytrichastri]|uniref:DUF6705 domain-containing protein n=2 Tax=Chryseobacterium polytrichastri TaxID=1302687 RepID=A0A1M7C894_9FLAO|nr:hypothetical protein SAMN05444267_102166 [Chryseobacterium polytrichastri]
MDTEVLQKIIVLKFFNLKFIIMKNLLIIFSLIFIGCKAQQQIIPLETKGWPAEGSYRKDLNNDLDPYVGTWKGTFEGKTFMITFTKIKDYDTLGKYYKDRIKGRYKMLDTSGNQLYSTYNLPEEKAKVSSLGFVNSTKAKLRFYFSDLCIGGQIVLNFDNPQKTQMHYIYYTEQEMIVDDIGCAPYNEMPRGEFTLTKQ